MSNHLEPQLKKGRRWNTKFLSKPAFRGQVMRLWRCPYPAVQGHELWLPNFNCAWLTGVYTVWRFRQQGSSEMTLTDFRLSVHALYWNLEGICLLLQTCLDWLARGSVMERVNRKEEDVHWSVLRNNSKNQVQGGQSQGLLVEEPIC